MKTVIEFDRLDEYQAEAKRAIRRGLSDGAVTVQADAVDLAPYETGRLRSSLNTREMGPLSFELYTNVEYAPYQEFGTRHMPAQPFMRPAYERNYQLIISMLQRELANL